MPVVQLAEGEETQVLELSVVGTYQQAPCVDHVALVTRNTAVIGRGPLAIYHMRPPLIVGQLNKSGREHTEHMLVDLLAWVESKLKPEEVDEMNIWLANVRTQVSPRRHPLDQYVALPAYEDERDPESNRFLRKKFSCVGFVEGI